MKNYLSWTELNTHSTNLTKERATVERALEQADKNVHKLGKELDDSESAGVMLVFKNCMMTNLKK